MRWVISQGGIDPAEPTLNGVIATDIFDNLSVTTSDTWDLNDFPTGYVNINQSLTIEPGVSLSISPVITVQFAANASLHIKPNALLDLSGKVLWSLITQSKAVWQTRDTPSGLYFYTLVCEGQPVFSGKISIVK